MTVAPPTLTWPKPGPGAWRFDGAHNLGPTTPMLQAVLPVSMADGFRSFTARYGLPVSHIDVRYVNGFAYGSPQIAGVPATDRPPPPAALMRVLTRLHPEFRRRNRAARAALERRIWREDLDRWFEELRPARVASVRALQSTDPDSLDDDALADHVTRCVTELADGLREHFSLVGASGIPVGLLVLREHERGRHPDETIAGLAGAATNSTAATLPHLTAIADALARTGVTPTTLDGVRESSPAVADALDRYLDEFGQRVVGAFDVTGRRLIELPELVVRSIATADRRPLAPSPLGAVFADGDPVADDARLAVASRDDHAGISCMWPLGLTRRALLSAGGRLRAAGRLAADDDVLVCSIDEIRALLRRSPGAPAPSTIARRGVDLRSLDGVVPPPVLGDAHAPPDPGVFPSSMRRVAAGMVAFLDALESAPSGASGADTDGRAHVGVGTGIGRGRHRGRAVVARDPDDAIARLEPGDVLITSTTTPAFNSVLPIAGALVTAHGGSMSHAGIAARELGVPAVVGVAGILALIPDGATVDVDAQAGTVQRVHVDEGMVERGNLGHDERRGSGHHRGG